MNRVPAFLALLSALLFGAATPASKLLLTGLSPFQLAGLLYLGAAFAMAPFALRQGGFGLPQRADRQNRMRLLGAVFFGGLVGPLALLFGLRLADASSVSLWLNLELAATAVLGALVFRDHLTRLGWAGVATALVGLVVLAWGPNTSGSVPALLVLAACASWGIDNHLTALIDGITPSQSTFWKGIVAGSVNFAIGWALEPVSISINSLAAALIVGALSYGASIVLYIRSAQSLGATRAQVLFATAPFFGVALSVFTLNEPFSATHAIAALFFAAGVFLLLAESHGHTHDHNAMSHKHAHRHDDGHHLHEHQDLSPEKRHTHRHDHEPVTHRHPHWPDIHHRHDHDAR